MFILNKNEEFKIEFLIKISLNNEEKTD